MGEARRKREADGIHIREDQSAATQFEARFAVAMETIGGVRPATLNARSDSQKNADFVFNGGQCISELKCLVDDPNSDGRFDRKVSSLFEVWIRERLVRPLPEASLINIQTLPPKCAEIVLAVAGRRMRDVVRKANDQITATKELLGFDGAPGLLILANIGYRSLSPESIVCCLARIHWQELANIDGLILMSHGIGYSFPGISMPSELWAQPKLGHETRPIPDGLYFRIREAWTKEASKGTLIYEFQTDDTWLGAMKA